MTASLLTLDVKGAFDSVLPSRLIRRLREQGWPTNLVLWIASFATGRSVQIRLDGEIGPSTDITCAAWPLRKRLPYTKSGSIQIRWVPGHAKIPENKVADLAAKEGAASIPENKVADLAAKEGAASIPPAPHKSSYASLKRYAKTQSLSAAQSQWEKVAP
ncbi:hypothetical protein TSTA_039900 [Talaromyces stipitatus ATCC 10500]|uniref:Uncharacterized protein n=1 Tax=Talaromyces stipitatus (strain ATCC 10500 / CBS 375.48 / QM 6759 / NRRL 1006) TaxID=441959 RepID=B8M453_TALSN|nr:uncharacterized protein TSTA_039900 [Talaromyces stipitatus ATCC 10500]EED20796.1 hypothetical protein TSTA_039900 [Talaromyces stipitatus ATCC 10500]